MISFVCPHCQQKVIFEDSSAGTKDNCPQCGGVLRVPDEANAGRGRSAARPARSKQMARRAGPSRPINWPVIGLVLAGVLAVCVVIAAGYGMYRLFFRDTWEADNSARLQQQYTQALDLKNQDKLDDSVTRYAQLVGTLAMREEKTPLHDPALLELQANAKKDLDDVRSLLDARNAREAKLAADKPAAPNRAPAGSSNNAPQPAANSPDIAEPAAEPVSVPGKRDAGAIYQDEQGLRDDLTRALKGDVYTDPATRAATLTTVAPLLARIEADAKEASALPGHDPRFVRNAQNDSYPYAAALGDVAAQTKIDAIVASADGEDVIYGKCFAALEMFLKAGSSDAAQSRALKVFADLLKSGSTRDPAIDVLVNSVYADSLASDRSMEKIEVMVTAGKSPVEKNSMESDLASSLAAHTRVMMQGQPLAVKGKTFDGSDFSSESLKGKVILVCFWASRYADDLPRVKAFYEKYHPEGLEVIGYCCDSNDVDAKAYLKNNPQMEWTELFTPSTPATIQSGPSTLVSVTMPPIAQQLGIFGVPASIAIDKNGGCRGYENGGQKDFERLIPKLLKE